MGWLEDMATTGVVRSIEGYLVGGGSADDGGEGDAGGVHREEVGDADIKGKGKAKEKEVDAKMVDITNSELFFLWRNA
jgi:hypothetical protein